MKKYLLLCIALIPFFGVAQNNVGIGIATPDASALLELSSTQQGLLVPRVSTVQRVAINTPANGLMVYDTDSACLFFYNGGAAAWRSLCTGGITGINYDCSIGTITLNGSTSSFTSANKAWLLSGNVAGTSGYFGTEDTAAIRLVTNNSGFGTACNFHNLSQKMIVTKDGNVGISYDGVTVPTWPRNKLLVENGTPFTGPDIYGRITFKPNQVGVLSVSNAADSANLAILGIVSKDNTGTNTGLVSAVSGNSATNTGSASIVNGDGSDNLGMYAQVTGNNARNTGMAIFSGIGSTGSTNIGLAVKVYGSGANNNMGITVYSTGSTVENTGLTTVVGEPGLATQKNGGLSGKAEGGLGTLQNYGTSGFARGLAQKNFGITGYADSGLQYNAGVQGIVDGDYNANSICVGVVGELFTGADGAQNYGVEGDLGRVFTPLPNIPYYAVYGIQAGFGGSGVNANIVAGNPAIVSYAGYFRGDVFSNDTYYASDPQLKENITDYSGALAQLNKLPVKQYIFNRQKFPEMNLPLGQRVGVLSTDLKLVFPNLVKPAISPGAIGEPSIHFEAVNYDALIPVLIQAVKELDKKSTAEQHLSEKVNAQDAKIAELTNQLSDLKNLVKHICNPTEAKLEHK